MASKNIKLRGSLKVPGDKSISHRALIFSALSKGMSQISGLSPAFDCLSTADCLEQVGIKIERRTAATNGHSGSVLLLTSPGLKGLRESKEPLFAGNSGTTIRLLSGLLAGSNFKSILDGDASLRKRPMGRVLKPLTKMGLSLECLGNENYAPFCLQGGGLTGQDFILDLASAQVQTALLLAGLQASGKTSVKVPGKIRDHSTRMFAYLGVPFTAPEANTVEVAALAESIAPYNMEIPADISSAAFFMVAAACLPGSELALTGLVLNPGRTLVLEVLKQMGADISLHNLRESCGEPVGDLQIRYTGKLQGVTICGDDLASGIDEIPALAIAGALCEGAFVVADASELRVKESDRIMAIVANLKNAGVDINESSDGFHINGGHGIAGGSVWKTYEDHRMAMSGVIAGLIAEQPIEIDNEECIAVSYPGFLADLAGLSKF